MNQNRREYARALEDIVCDNVAAALEDIVCDNVATGAAGTAERIPYVMELCLT